MLRHQAKIGPAADHRRPDRARQAHRLRRRAILAGPFRPARRAGAGCRRRYPDAQLEARRRLAGRSGAGLRPYHPGKRLPPRRGQPGRRGRADAGAAGHRRRYRAGARDARVGELTDPPINLEYGQSFIELMRAQSRRPRASCRRSSPPIMPGRCRSAAGTTSTTRAIRCCGSRASPIGRRASTCPRCCGTCGSTSSSKARRNRASRRSPSTSGRIFPPAPLAGALRLRNGGNSRVSRHGFVAAERG